MGNGRRGWPAGVVVAMVAACAIGSSSAIADDDYAGRWIVVDGPLAGTTIAADADGTVAMKGQRKGRIRPPDADCPHWHFQGVEGGGGEKKVTIKEVDCLRVVDRVYAQDVLQSLADAIVAEEKGKIDQSLRDLRHAVWDIESSATADENLQAAVKKRIKRARSLDEEARDARKAGNRKRADALLDEAIKVKHQTANIATTEVKVYLPPKLDPLDAVFQPVNTRTVYTLNITPRPGSTVRYIWAFAELNDPTCVNFEPNKPAKNQAIWNHGDTQGCNHALEGSNGHQGVIGATVYDTYFVCGTAYLGSSTGTGPAPQPCQGAYGPGW